MIIINILIKILGKHVFNQINDVAIVNDSANESKTSYEIFRL